MVDGFFNSEERLYQPTTPADYVRLLYRTILEREAADEEVSAWVDGALVPALNALVPGFVGSPEFRARAATTPPAAVIARLYRYVLGRPESAEENAAWVADVGRTTLVAIVTDTTVMDLHGPTLVRALHRAGIEPEIAAIPPGERHKTLGQACRLLDWLTGTQTPPT